MKNASATTDSPSKRHGISRREMVQRLVTGASTGIVASSIATPVAAEVMAPAAAPAAAIPAQAAQSAEWAPVFLDSHQVDTLNVLAEIIIPGSGKAQVTQFIDVALSEDSLENRTQFVAAISAIDGEAMRRESVPFGQLAPAQQIEILTYASKITPSASVATPVDPTMASGSALPGNLRDHFENLKEWVRKSYYSSEIGLRELGWSDNYFYSGLPPCDGTTS